MKNPPVWIGIDTGVNTGVAVWLRGAKQFSSIETLPIHQAMELVRRWHNSHPNSMRVRVEDARKRKYFGKSGTEVWQGVGSIKRDAKIWEDFLTELGCDFELVAPKDNKTKLSAAQFKQYTGWQGKTTEHSRDAGMLVFNF